MEPSSDSRPTSSEPWVPREGELLDGRYRVSHIIGQGGMGAVVAAEHVHLGGNVAIKFLDPTLARDDASIGRFLREAKATMRIKSEHVVRIVDVGRTEAGAPYIAMELLEGQDLGRLLGDRGPLPLTSAVDYVLQASEALAEAHAAGIVHRDLKPANLWLARRSDGSPLVKVLDFGISKLTSHAQGDPKLTETQAVFGSPTYMSPEQIRSAKSVDHRTDVWALGVVLYELLADRLPFDAETIPGVLAAISADPPLPLRPLRPEVPPALESAILACLEKDVGRRCRSLAALAAMLSPFASPVGAISADRIGRIGAVNASLLPPPAPAVSGGYAAATANTEQAFATVPTTRTRPPSPRVRRLLGAGITAILVGSSSAAFVLVSPRPKSTQAASLPTEPVQSAGQGPRPAVSVPPPTRGTSTTPDVAPTSPTTPISAGTPGARRLAKPSPSTSTTNTAPATSPPPTATLGPLPKPGSTISDTSQ